ncbi:MAG TPA: isoaspartyl peptidase/L-asparaginase [Candidatus Competibacteraceae bacterium]|nr:isoaspartyl peptidase/L-asparaginase [Candidatus Competibacteraceae bacterium]
MLTATRDSLHRILDAVYRLLLDGADAVTAVVRGCQYLEDDPVFNAGTGAVLQADGEVRLSAGLMDGVNRTFSGVINVIDVQNPILLAEALQAQPDRILADPGTIDLLRELGLPVHNPLTERRLQEWLRKLRMQGGKVMTDKADSQTQAGSDPVQGGTIGVVALDTQGRLVAGTSTGGKSFAHRGRVSDSATPAGNYANDCAAVSCTGIGEDILDECLAARIVVRVSDGLSLRAAFELSFAEAERHHRNLGAIGLDAGGAIAWGKTSRYLRAAYHTGEQHGDTLDLETGPTVDSI